MVAYPHISSSGWMEQIFFFVQSNYKCFGNVCYTLQENVTFQLEKLTKNYPNCHHVQIDQNVILDKSIWTKPF
jgi:hypothetical protein